MKSAIGKILELTGGLGTVVVGLTSLVLSVWYWGLKAGWLAVIISVLMAPATAIATPLIAMITDGAWLFAVMIYGAFITCLAMNAIGESLSK